MAEKDKCMKCNGEVEGHAGAVLYLQSGTKTAYRYRCECGFEGTFYRQGEDPNFTKNSGLLTI